MNLSNGVSDPVIKVDTEGTYSLTIVDACMETATGSIDVTFPEQLENLVIDVTLGEDCERILTAVTNVDGQVGVTYEWADSLDVFIDDDRSIEVTESGVYFVTVDYCGRSLTEEEDLKLDNNLLWPKVFFPRGEDENKTLQLNNLSELDMKGLIVTVRKAFVGMDIDSTDTDLLNIRDEMLGELNKLSYLLTLE